MRPIEGAALARGGAAAFLSPPPKLGDVPDRTAIMPSAHRSVVLSSVVLGEAGRKATI